MTRIRYCIVTSRRATQPTPIGQVPPPTKTPPAASPVIPHRLPQYRSSPPPSESCAPFYTQLRSDTSAQITAISARADQETAAARAGACRCARERDDAIAAAAQARHTAGTEISRAQAETDARDLAAQLRADAARERDALAESCQAQLASAHALTQAERARAERAEAQLETERADRRTLTSHLTSTASDNGQQPRPGPRVTRR